MFHFRKIKALDFGIHVLASQLRFMQNQRNGSLIILFKTFVNDNKINLNRNFKTLCRTSANG